MTLPGPNLRSGANSCVPNSGQQGPGLHNNNQDPGFSSDLPHQVFAHPVFYIQAPPPPTFLHYHWPMPFSYNPFTGFPGMGYGVVMPPAPPPFIEAPAYILPHPPIQAVDYRRLLQPQVHAPTAPYQNPNQTFRIRPPHTGPVRETVNSEVQTEPTHRGVGGYGGFARSDSGHGTASSSPSSSSSSQKQGSAEVENYTLPNSNTENFQEWLLQNGMFETEVIVEMTEEAENCGHSTQNDLIVKASKKRQTRRFSSSDSVPMSDSWLIFSTPAEKLCQPEKPELESDIYASEMTGPKQGQSMAPSEKDPLVSSTCMQSKIIVSSPTVEGVDENGSSEPEANQSPNQESLIGSEKQEKSHCPPEQEATLFLSSTAGEEISPTGHLTVGNRVDTEVKNWACGNEEVSQLRNEKLCPPVADQRMAEVSPSKGHLVDCGIQCTELQGLKCFCEELKGGMGPNRRHPYKYSGMKKANNDKTEGFCMNGQQKRHNQRWNRGSGTHNSQQEAYYGYSGKPGKFKGKNYSLNLAGLSV
ncbi:uncharacterized protein AKAME5_001855500 [Lates japonicus]|uniref:Uncharacterized protein n=1 Tax=Lates japonicus TaxID=270547 RepID=A0AAD3N7K2_LATJO|nr:uncharacterized protein AKAME5_001855500 [Lates japonicus]